jgi:hypothetical protein
MWRLAALLLVLPLAACYSDQKQEMAECHASAPHGAFVVQRCMRDHGYDPSFSDCLGLAAPYQHAECYRPRDTLANALFDVEMLFHARPSPPEIPN